MNWKTHSLKRFADDMVGRLKSFRIAGKALAFLDLVQDDVQVQAVCNLSRLDAFGGVLRTKFRDFHSCIQRGDIICEINLPTRRLPLCRN